VVLMKGLIVPGGELAAAANDAIQGEIVRGVT
jgi:hypothetical protein